MASCAITQQTQAGDAQLQLPRFLRGPRYAFFQEERHQRLEMIHEKAPMSTMQILLQHSSELYLRELCFWLRPIYSFFFPTNFKRSSLPTCPMFQITCICCKDWGQRKGGKLFSTLSTKPPWGQAFLTIKTEETICSLLAQLANYSEIFWWHDVHH